MPGQTYSRLGRLGGAPSPPPVPPAVAAVASLQRGGGGSGRRTPGKGGSASASAAAGWTGVGCGCAARRAARAVLAALHRRQAVFLFAPLLYVAAMLLYMGSIPLDVVPRIVARPAPGSVYRSPQLYARLRADMDADNSTDALATLWRYKGSLWRPCINNATNSLPESNGYIYIEANGGLNQQRTSICNAVAIAGFLNATLVIPNFHFHSIWRDPRLIRISPFANRLSFDAPPVVQRLRCLANFEALKFSNPIATLSETLVSRMKEKSTASNGKYIAVHLRFEEDMVAFSCCVYDGGDEEKKEMNAAREIGWRGKFTKRGRVIRPGVIRMNGKCPLTPLEVGLMLRGMGFSNNTAIFLASGKIYRAEKNMVPLLEMFPLLQTKETLASAEELAPFKDFSSRMAAIDYSVCVHSDAFVTTQGGNFPHFLMGHRRYLYAGHSRTIKPDKRKLAILFDNPRIGWKSLKRHLLNMRTHSDAKGVEMKRPIESIYTFPCPNCMCRLNRTENSKHNQTR
ncbi:protein ESMERALDA 1 isoform X1 [Oryza sativa Japonica Group]|uniref:protein ESMERALDA 1 isoform X1 n=1 Tax=Oryza sativa subsp. japonica TaxID=39947 RepID=UPI0007754FDA|nr:protein ESMERALDA 1 isoform X2 [Oryza sativa Japonica Group]